MLIEFVGMPGVGKTTLGRALAADLLACGYRTAFVGMDAPPERGRYRKLFDHLREIVPYLLENPGAAVRALQLLRHFPQPRLAASLSRLRYWLRVGAVIRRRRRTADIVILDQGHMQGLLSWALFAPTYDPAALAGAVRVVPQPELLILVTASKDVVRTRLRRRNYGYRQIDRLLLGDDRQLETCARIITQIERAAQQSRCHIIRACSSDDDVASVTRQLVLAALASAGHTKSA